VTANLRRDKFIVFGGVTTDRLVSSNCDGSTATQDIGARQPEFAALLRRIPTVKDPL
jgi:hypothetical protein